MSLFPVQFLDFWRIYYLHFLDLGKTLLCSSNMKFPRMQMSLNCALYRTVASQRLEVGTTGLVLAKKAGLWVFRAEGNNEEKGLCSIPPYPWEFHNPMAVADRFLSVVLPNPHLWKNKHMQSILLCMCKITFRRALQSPSSQTPNVTSETLYARTSPSLPPNG
ncbi:UNVERIFIED_CONTAM: hypothetical protein Sradi_1470700 [Sesamum radiatum]|uniref:Uncharacterized protein n=1 Tax=Sesamum radiatum TaxID=300843 RepID=A0AAW2U641_SESRA